MRRSPACRVAALIVLMSAGPAFANLLYVPLAVNVEYEGVSYRTQLWVTNRADDQRRLDTYFIATDEDGTDRPEESGTGTPTPAGTTLFVQSVTDPGTTGILEASGVPAFLVKAELASFIDGTRVTSIEIPVLTPDNTVEAGSTAHLLPWERTGSLRTDFGLVNLGQESTQCAVDLLGPDGESLVPSALITVPPLSQRGFVDVLGNIGMPNLAAGRASVSCDRPFYAFLLQRDVESGAIQFIGPAGDLGLGFGDDPPPPPLTCGEGAICFEQPGTFHRPTPANPVARLRFPVPAGNYSRIHLQMDFRHGGWFAGRPNGLHNIFWMVQSARNRDMYGYLNFWGPDRNAVLFRHGIGVSQEGKARLTAPAVITPGQVYHVDLIYQVNPRLIEVSVTGPGGQEVVNFVTAPNVGNISFGAGDDITMDFGFVEGLNPNEPPTYGWQYRNLLLEVIP